MRLFNSHIMPGTHTHTHSTLHHISKCWCVHAHSPTAALVLFSWVVFPAKKKDCLMIDMITMLQQALEIHSVMTVCVCGHTWKGGTDVMQHMDHEYFNISSNKIAVAAHCAVFFLSTLPLRPSSSFWRARSPGKNILVTSVRALMKLYFTLSRNYRSLFP